MTDDLINAKTIKTLLEQQSIVPRKSWGQSFLIDKNVLEKVISAGNLSKKDTVIEIGPGLGALTLSLAKNVKRVIAVERDKKLTPLLREKLSEEKNIDVVNRDILSFGLQKFSSYKVVGNIPYYITSPIIRKFLETENRPSLLVLTIQKEVAERVCAKPPHMNLLAVSVQFFATPEVVAHVSPSSFYPPPSVASSILRIIPYNKESEFDSDFQKNFFSLARAGFSHPRKQLLKNFKMSFPEKTVQKIKGSEINLQRRAETLSVEEWIILGKLLSK